MWIRNVNGMDIEMYLKDEVDIGMYHVDEVYIDTPWMRWDQGPDAQMPTSSPPWVSDFKGEALG